MSNGISGYDPSRLSHYRSIEKPFDGSSHQDAAGPASGGAADGKAALPYLGPDLSAEETKMIDRHFPPSNRMTMRLYGPGRTVQSIDPHELGTRLDVRG